MPTQDERLTALEEAQAKFGEAVNDLNHHVTMLIGIVQRQEWDIREMKGSLRTFEQGVNNRFDVQDKKLDQILLLLNTLTPQPGQETQRGVPAVRRHAPVPMEATRITESAWRPDAAGQACPGCARGSQAASAACGSRCHTDR